MGAYPGGSIIRVTPTLSTDAYAQNDVLTNATEIPNAVSSRGGVSKLINVSILNQNKDDLDVDIVFMQVQTNLGTINDAVGSGSLWTDDLAQAAKVIGHIRVDGSDALCNLIGSKLTSFSGPSGDQTVAQMPMLLQAEPGSTSVYFAAILRSAITPTYVADDIDFHFHIEYIN